MGYYVEVYSFDGKAFKGAKPTEKQGKYNSFKAIGDIRLDEKSLTGETVVSQGYLTYFKWVGEVLWEFSSLLIVYNHNDKPVKFCLIIFDGFDGSHLLLERGVPKRYQGQVFFFTEEGEVKVF